MTGKHGKFSSKRPTKQKRRKLKGKHFWKNSKKVNKKKFKKVKKNFRWKIFLSHSLDIEQHNEDYIKAIRVLRKKN